MALPFYGNVSALRMLERKCARLSSATSTKTVAQLSGLSVEDKEAYLFSAVFDDLLNLALLCLEAGAAVDSKGGADAASPVLVVAAQRGNVRTLQALLDAGADHSLTDPDGFTALSTAAEQGQLECVHALLAAGADANKATALGTTPLMKAISRKHNDCARALLPVSELSRADGQGLAAFHVSVMTANQEGFEMLLPRVSDVDARSVAGVDPNGVRKAGFGQTPLHLAALKGQPQMAAALLSRGADRMARDDWQRTPLHSASQEGFLSCVTLLIGQPSSPKMTPADVNAVDVHGATALHLAALKGFEKGIGVLLEAGARLDLKTSQGQTPLSIARAKHPTNAALRALLSGTRPAQLPGTVCDQCRKTAEQAGVNSLKGCTQCLAVRYCSTACGAAAWPGHRQACKARRAEREQTTRAEILAPLSDRRGGECRIDISP